MITGKSFSSGQDKVQRMREQSATPQKANKTVVEHRLDFGKRQGDNGTRRRGA